MTKLTKLVKKAQTVKWPGEPFCKSCLIEKRFWKARSLCIERSSHGGLLAIWCSRVSEHKESPGVVARAGLFRVSVPNPTQSPISALTSM